jgi:capsular exopolysaccharide synthesis family protein
MLQLNNSLVNVGGGRSIPFATPSPAEMFKAFTDFLRRQYPIILFFVLMGIGLGVAYIFTAPPMFTAETSMIVDTHKVQMFRKQDSVAPSNASIDSGLVESEVEMLKSENVSLAVIKRFNLVDDPEFSGRIGSPFQMLFEAISGLFSHDAPKSEYERTRRAAAVFADRLTVKRIGLSYILQIGFTSLDSKRAADIADAVANAYIIDQLQAQFEVARQAGVWLQDRLRELREQATAAERAVVEFKATNNIVKSGGSDKRLIDEQQVGELNSQLVIARAQVSESRARLDRIQAVLRAESPDATVDATVTDTLKNEVITHLRSQYLTLAEREADWSRRYGKSHLAVVNTRNQMNEIKNSILDELGRIAESYKSDYEIAKQRQVGIERELAQAVIQSQVVDRAHVQLMELESNALSYRTLYDDFLLRYTESVQQQSFPMTQARVVTPAARPLMKSQPRSLLVLLLSAGGGMILGLIIGHLRDLADRVFRTRDQVERVLALDCLATVPKVRVGKPKSYPSRTLDIKVGEPKGGSSPAPDIKGDEQKGDSLPAPDIVAGETQCDSFSDSDIKVGEPNDDASSDTDVRILMPKVAPWPAPDINVGGPNDDSSPDPDIKIGGPNDDSSPDPDTKVGIPEGDPGPNPGIKVGKPKDDLSPEPIGIAEGDSKPVAEVVDVSSDPRTIARLDQLLWQVVDFPLSPYTEAIRSIKMAVDLTRARISKKVRKPKKVIGITSSSPSEGKSTIAASLAQLISHSGKRVILVDCDLRAPRLTRVMAPDAKAGLLEVLSGDASIHDVIWTDQSKQLSFLPAVATARIPHTAEIIAADEMRALFDRLREAYDYVIVDLTPLVPIIDVRATEGLVDYYIFVVEWGRTKIDLVERSLKEASGIYSKILGVVLNKVGGGELKRYEGYGGYDHDKYYHR